MPSREDSRVGCSSRCMCMIRLQRHMGAVALMGPGSDAEWDWLPTELGCCCPESESNTHNANVSAKLTDGRVGALRTHRPKERWFLPAWDTSRGASQGLCGRRPGSKERALRRAQPLQLGFQWFQKAHVLREKAGMAARNWWVWVRVCRLHWTL